MKKLFLTILASLVLAGQAMAADLSLKPVWKAPVSVPCTIINCSGFYGGLDGIFAVSDLNPLGAGLSNSATLTNFGGHFGYQQWNGKWFLAGEIHGAYDVTGNTSGSNRFMAMELVKVGYSLSSLFGQASTTSSPIQLPVDLAAALITPYFITGEQQIGKISHPVGGFGVQLLVSQNNTLSLDYLNAPAINNTPVVNSLMFNFDHHF